jgi:hypothetical protein
MRDEWLNDMMMHYIEKEIFRSLVMKKIIQGFEQIKKRCMLLQKNLMVCSIIYSPIINVQIHFEVICHFLLNYYLVACTDCSRKY